MWISSLEGLSARTILWTIGNVSALVLLVLSYCSTYIFVTFPGHISPEQWVLLFFFFFFCIPLFMEVVTSTPVSWEMNCMRDHFHFPCHLGSRILSLRVDQVCAVFSCVQDTAQLPKLGIFNTHTEVNACNCPFLTCTQRSTHAIAHF